jgi:CheY-like chemotaxis protein
MARIVCFADNAAVANVVQQGLGDREHTLYFLTASRLTNELRQTVQHLAPDVILLELSHALDNPHLYFFLRADRATRHIPIILVSSGARLEQQAAILGADGYLQRPFGVEQLWKAVSAYLMPQQALAAAA